MKASKLMIFMLLALSFFSIVQPAMASEATLLFFWGDGCPHCMQQKPFLEEMQLKYPELNVEMYETWSNPENAKLFQEVMKLQGKRAEGVPTTVLGENIWVGFSERMRPDIESKIIECLEKGCPSPIENGEKENVQETFSDEPCIHVFIERGCGQCEAILPFLESVAEKKDMKLSIYDVNVQENKELYLAFKEIYKVTALGYPVAFVGERILVGRSAIEKNLESHVDACRDNGCPCPLEKITAVIPQMAGKEDITSEELNIIELPFVGSVDIGKMPLFLMTALISFIDGFNPCSLWVITFLLGIVIYTGSRKKVFLVGLTFFLVTTTAYGLFMLGLLNVFSYVRYTNLIKIGVSLIAIIFALINIKDYFWYKKGISLTISDKYKPTLYKKVRNIMDPNKSTLSMLLATVLMALGIVLVELPCTAGFPMIWTNIISHHNVTGWMFVSLFALYMIIYLLDELVVFIGMVITLRASKFEEKHGRMLKLIGGMVMLALAVALVFFSDIMNTLSGSLYIFGAAIVLSFLIMFLHRKVLPKYGIIIGTEELGEDTSSDEKQEKQDKKNKKKGGKK